LFLFVVIAVQLIGEDILDFRWDIKFLIFWGWAMLEIIHHHYYKLTFGTRDTLQYVLENCSWSDIRKPIGGAIGIQLKKVRFRNIHLEDKCT
jgi:hypothetical protein